jgi:short-subunit dehydrogenase
LAHREDIMENLRGRTAVITGAASGIGRALAVSLRREGCHLAISDVNAQGLAETEALVTSSTLRTTTHLVDVADRAAMIDFVEQVIEAHGGVNLVINNAGVTVEGTFEEQSLEDWDFIVGVNFWGVLHGCKLFLPHLKVEDEGHIVNISSIFGVVGIPAQSSYCATKYAVRGLSESLWEELKGTHVGVTVVHPGGVNTNIAASARTYNSDEGRRKKVIEFFEKKTMPAGVAADEIVAAVKAGKKRLVVTREAVVADLIKRAFPVTGNHRIVDQMVGMMGATQERKDKQAEFRAQRGTKGKT